MGLSVSLVPEHTGVYRSARRWWPRRRPRARPAAAGCRRAARRGSRHRAGRRSSLQAARAARAVRRLRMRRTARRPTSRSAPPVNCGEHLHARAPAAPLHTPLIVAAVGANRSRAVARAAARHGRPRRWRRRRRRVRRRAGLLQSATADAAPGLAELIGARATSPMNQRSPRGSVASPQKPPCRLDPGRTLREAAASPGQAGAAHSMVRSTLPSKFICIDSTYILNFLTLVP